MGTITPEVNGFAQFRKYCSADIDIEEDHSGEKSLLHRMLGTSGILPNVPRPRFICD